MSKASKNAAPIPVIVPIPNPNGELNDVEWKAFIFTVLPDCKQHENTPTPAVFQQLFDHISSGLRQRFFVISRSELLNWASETSRAYDVSRDVKAFMDSSTADSEFPEVLMAKLVKLRLLVLKHEGIEQRNALKLMKEASDAAVVPSEAPDTQKFVKAGKKEEKEKEKDKDKDKERGKQTTPKKGGKEGKAGGAKAAAEAISRPASGRKSKFKDKNGKSDAKMVAIGDEPENGPDAYYILRDFYIPGLANALMEECGIPVQAIFTVECCANDSTQTLSLEGRDVESKKEPIYTSFPPPLSYRASNCRLISTVREWMLDSEEVSLWRNLAWCDVRRSDFTDARDLFDVIAINIYDLLKEIVTFEKFYENSQVVKVSHSSMEETALSSADWRYYNKISSSLPSLCSDVVLGLVVDLAFNEDYMKNTTLERPPLGDVITTDLSAYRRPNGRFNALGNMQFLSKKNKGGLTSAGFRNSNLIGSRATDILNSMKIQYRARKYQALAEQSPETFAESTKNLSGREGKRERMVFKGELRRISKIPEKYRNKLGLQLEFEDMLGISKNLNTNDIVDKPKVSLDSWCWTEILDSSSLTEVLQEAKHHLSVAVTRRSENDGRLLLALHGPGKVCDESFTFFEQVKVKTKVDFGLFHDLFKNNKNVLDPLAPSAEQLEEKPSTVIDSEKSQSPEVHFETKLQTPPSAMDDFGVIDMSTYLDASESSLLEEEDDGQILAAHNNSNNVSRAVSPTKAVDASQIATPKASDIVYDMGGRIVHESDQNTVLYTSFGTQVRIHKELTSGALLRRRESRGGILVKILSGPNILSFSAGNPLPQSSPSYRLQNPETASLMLSSEDGTILSVSGKSASFYSTNNAKAAAALITPTVSVNASSTPYPYPSQPSAPPVSLATLSLADGSVTEIRTNGSILLKSGEILKAKEENVFLNDKTESLTEQLRSLEAKEIARSILPNGSVVSYLSNRACRVIFPNGNTAFKSADDSWTSINQSTGQSLRTSANYEKKERNTVNIVREVFPKYEHITSTTFTPPSSSDHLLPTHITFSREDGVSTTLISRPSAIDARQEIIKPITFDVVADHADQTRIKSRFSVITKEDSVVPEVTLLDLEQELYSEPNLETLEKRFNQERVVISAEEMGAKVVIKDNGLFMRLEFWNGAVLQRRFSGDGDFTIHYIRDDYTLELNSKGESKFIPKHYLPKSPEEIYEFNWLLGTLQTVDSSNTSFTINADGSFEVTKVPATDRPTSPSRTRGVQKDGTLVSALLRSEWSPDPTVPRNPPRLFVIDEDGSGVELLRDMDLIPYLRREINNPETTIVEEPLEDENGAIGVNIVTKVTVLEDRVKLKDPVVTYRMLTRHPPMTLEMRRQLLADMKQYRDWQDSEEEKSSRLLGVDTKA